MRNYFLIIFFCLTSITYGSGQPDHFPSRIYHNSTKKEFAYQPTFTLLNTQEGFDLPQAIDAVNNGNIDTIIFIIAGQQNFLYGVDDEADILYGKALTGGDRILLNGQFLWTGSFRVHTSKVYSSVASRLYDKYHARALIVDVLNAKYDWERTTKSKNQVFKNFYEKFRPLMNALARKGDFNCFISGFSRGAVMALRLAETVQRDFGHVKAVITVDPVINPLSDEASMIVGIARHEEGWQILDPEEYSRSVRHSFTEVFPILQTTDGMNFYNVFQRRSLKEAGFVAKPIGSAVSGAVSPFDTGWEGIVPADRGSPFNQYDTSIAKHTPDMLERYGPWIDQVIASYLK